MPVTYNTVQRNTSPLLSGARDPLLIPRVGVSESAHGLSDRSKRWDYRFKSHFLKIFSRCYPNALNGAAQVSAENKSPVDNFGIEMRWDTALQRAHERRDRFGKEPSAKQENVESNFNANGH